MPSRIYWYAESLSRGTTTTTNYSVVAATLTFQPNDSQTYAIFWNVIIDGNSTSNFSKIRLINTTASVTYSELDSGAETTTVATNTRPYGSLALYTSGAGPAQQTIQIQVCSSNSALTTGYSEACIFILELDANDVSTSSTSADALTGQTYTTKITVTIPSGAANDWLVVTSADYQNTTVGQDPDCRIYVNDATAINVHEHFYYRNTTHYHSFMAMNIFSAVTTQQTTALQYRCAWSNPSVTIRNAYGVALRLDLFDNKYLAEDRTVHTSTSSSYADSATTGAITPANVPHIVMAAGMNNSTATTSMAQKINGDSVDVGTIFIHCHGEANYWASWFALRKITPAASSQTWKTQYARTVGADTPSSDEHVIALLQLESAANYFPALKSYVPYVGDLNPTIGRHNVYGIGVW